MVEESLGNIFKVGPIIAIPVAHGRIAYSKLVRKFFYEYLPSAVAIELPPHLKKVVIQGIKRLPYLSIIVEGDLESNPTFYPVDPADPIIEAIRLALENNIDLHLVDATDKEQESNQESLLKNKIFYDLLMPDDYSLDFINLEDYYRAFLESRKDIPDSISTRERIMVQNLQELSKKYERILFVCGMSHWKNVQSLLSLKDELLQEIWSVTESKPLKLYSIPKKQAEFALNELPFFVWYYEKHRDTFKREDALRALFLEAQRIYYEKYDIRITPAIQRRFMQYVRNLAIINSRLFPTFLDMILSAKGCIDDDFAYEMYRLGRSYLNVEDFPTLPELNLMQFIDEDRLFKLRFRRRRLMPRPYDFREFLKDRPEEGIPGLWKKIWEHGLGYWSHIPEDLFQEAYLSHVREKAILNISEDRIRLHEFKTSFFDGIDYRETIRHFHEGKIFVREYPQIKGRIGAVAIIWDENSEKYPVWSVLHAEHDQESDFLYYGSPIGADIIGPGISRQRFGGLLSIFPPRRIYQIYFEWEMPDAVSTLLMNAVYWTKDKYIAYVAQKPPNDYLVRLAHLNGKQLVYLPIGSFQKTTIQRLQTFHLLSHRDLRKFAGDYVPSPGSEFKYDTERRKKKRK